MRQVTSIQIVSDEKGNTQAVLIPIREWEKIQKELKMLREMKSMKKHLRKALSEVKKMKQGELPKLDMKSFLNEC